MTDERADSFLAHHGILGQKWGIRRFQNKDGTLTQAGKERYLSNGSYVKKAEEFYDGYKKECKKYQIKAAAITALEYYPKCTFENLDDAAYGYMNNDFDQGTGNSVYLYAIENGKMSDANDIVAEYSKDLDFDDYNDKQQNAVYNALDATDGAPLNRNGADEKFKAYKERAEKLLSRFDKELVETGDGWKLLNQAIKNLGLSGSVVEEIKQQDTWDAINAEARRLRDSASHSGDSVDNFLAHHGILGQKWGVRRYQNEDGTLTEAGKKRYRKDLDRATSYQSKIDKNASKIDDKTNSPKSKIRRGKLESRKLYFESKKSQFEPRASKAIARRLSGRKSLFGIENLPTEKFLDNRAIYKFGKYNSRVAEIDRILRRMDKSIVDLEVKNVKLDGKIRKLFDRYKNVPVPNFRSDFEERKKTLGHSEDFDNFLEHHGILGQRWGIRRYQNKDGSLTAAGKKRRDKLLKQLESVGGVDKPGLTRTNSSGKIVKKTQKQLEKETAYLNATDAYQRALNNSMQSERAYQQTMSRPLPEQQAPTKDRLANLAMLLPNGDKKAEKIRKETERLRAENDYQRALNESIRFEQEYKKLMEKPAPPPKKSVLTRMNDLGNALGVHPVKDMYSRGLNIGEAYLREQLGLNTKDLKKAYDNAVYQIKLETLNENKKRGNYSKDSYLDAAMQKELNDLRGKGGNAKFDINKLSEDDIRDLFDRLDKYRNP